MSFGHQRANCGRCGVNFPVAVGHRCKAPEEGAPEVDNLRQIIHDMRNGLAHQADQLLAAASRERVLVGVIERLWRFTGGLQLGDQPMAIQRERAAIAHVVVAALMPQSAVNDSMGDALYGMLHPTPRGGGGGGVGGGGGGVMVINGKVAIGVKDMRWGGR
jgi:hypothetical protein